MNVIQPPLPDTYWVEQGKFLAGPSPLSVFNNDPYEKIRILVGAGINNYIDLTHIEEFNDASYFNYLQKHPDHDSLRYFNFPIDDFGIPTDNQMRKILDKICQILKDGGKLYLHCYGGIGRTGTTVGCYLVEQGMTGNQALTKIMELREGLTRFRVSSPETIEQINFILNWQSRWFADRG